MTPRTISKTRIQNLRSYFGLLLFASIAAVTTAASARNSFALPEGVELSYLDVLEDGAYLIAGKKRTATGDLDAFIGKFTQQGELKLNATFGTPNDDSADYVYETSEDGEAGYIVFGSTKGKGVPPYIWYRRLTRTGTEIETTRKYYNNFRDVRDEKLQAVLKLPSEEGKPVSFILAASAKVEKMDARSTWVLRIDSSGAIKDSTWVNFAPNFPNDSIVPVAIHLDSDQKKLKVLANQWSGSKYDRPALMTFTINPLKFVNPKEGKDKFVILSSHKEWSSEKITAATPLAEGGFILALHNGQEQDTKGTIARINDSGELQTDQVDLGSERGLVNVHIHSILEDNRKRGDLVLAMTAVTITDAEGQPTAPTETLLISGFSSALKASWSYRLDQIEQEDEPPKIILRSEGRDTVIFRSSPQLGSEFTKLDSNGRNRAGENPKPKKSKPKVESDVDQDQGAEQKEASRPVNRSFKKILAGRGQMRLVKEVTDGYLVATLLRAGGEDWDIGLTKISSEGNVLWNRSYGGVGVEEVIHLSERKVAGKRQYVLFANSIVNDDHCYVSFAVFDDNGREIREARRTYSNVGPFQSVRSVVFDPGTNTYTTIGTAYPPRSKNSYVLAMQMDVEGNVIKQKLFEEPENGGLIARKGRLIVPMSEKRFIALAQAGSRSDEGRAVKLLWLDTSGSEIRLYQERLVSSSGVITASTSTKNREIVIALADGPDENGLGSLSNTLLRVSPTGDLLKEVSIEHRYQLTWRINSVAEATNGDFLLATSHGAADQRWQMSQCAVIRTSRDFVVKRRQEFFAVGASDHARCMSVQQLSDRTLLIGGDYVPKFVQQMDERRGQWEPKDFVNSVQPFVFKTGATVGE